MDFGLSFLPDARPTSVAAAQYFADALSLAAVADAEGLASVKMTEHYLHPYGGFCPSPLGFLAAVAARTQHLRLLTGGVLPAFHHPVQLASETAMVDAISGGRLEVGFARAYLPYEFATFDVPMDESRARFTAAVEAVVRLWTEEAVTIETPFFSCRDATTLPRSTQHPHPPVWIAASVSPESFAWVGRKGFGLLATSLVGDRGYLHELIRLYRAAFHEEHGAGRPSRLALSLPLYIGRTESDAVREGDRFLARYMDVWADAADAWRGRESSAYFGYELMADAIRNSTPERLREKGAALVGTAPQVAERIEVLREEFGVDRVLWQVDFGAMPGHLAMRTLRAFVAEVLPRLSGASTCVDGPMAGRAVAP